MEYSEPVYIDYKTHQLVRADYTPYKLPAILTSLQLSFETERFLMRLEAGLKLEWSQKYERQEWRYKNLDVLRRIDLIQSTKLQS